jgi:hypothetical protein
MTLEDYCNTLSESLLIAIATDLCEVALRNWENYCKYNKAEYQDSVCSLKHSVRKDLLYDTVLEAKQILQRNEMSEPELYTEIRDLLKEFQEHIISLQDWDWHLPYETEKTFYSIYNLAKGFIDKRTGNDTLTHYIGINQAIEAIEEGKLLSENELRKILYERPLNNFSSL